jgi:hypothetical protein
VTEVNSDSIYWFGNCDGNLDRNILLFYDVFRYQIWSMKIRKVFDNYLLLENVFNHIRTIFKVKTSIKNSLKITIICHIFYR